MKLTGDQSNRPNPFRPVIPDGADPETILGLFEKVDTFDALRWKGHHVVVGPRGSGKSMILRRLSAAVKAKANGHENPEFLGVYIPIRSAHAEMFRRSFRETGDDRPFQHFLICYVLAQLVAAIRSRGFASLTTSAIGKIIAKECSCCIVNADGDLASLKIAFDEQWRLAVRIADTVTPARSEFMQSARLPDILSQVTGVLRGTTEERDGIGLLIDGYGYLRELAGFINQWMRKDLVDDLSVKVSSVTSHEAIKSVLIESAPEPNHDYVLVPHQFNPISRQCLAIFRAIANKRLKRAGLAVSVEDLLPRSLEPQEKSRLRWVSPPPTSLEYAAALSGGDVGAFIQVLELTWNSMRKNEMRYPLSAEAFGICCRKSSETYWKETIPVQARDDGRELQSLTRTAASRASELSSSASSPNTVVVGFRLKDHEKLDPQVKRIVQTGLRLGILQCNLEERAAMEVDSEYCPTKIELNRRLCAYGDFGLDPRGSAHADVTSAEFLEWVRKPYHGQDDKPAGGAAVRSQFSWATCVFVSSPLPTHGYRRSDYQRRLLSGLYRALSSAQQDSARLAPRSEQSDLVRDPLDLKVEDFVTEIPNAIKGCKFVIHEVTELSPGVAFELGLGVGYEKVRALVWDDARRPFTPGELPPLVEMRFNVNHFPFKGHAGFNSWIDDKVVRPCLERLMDTSPQRGKRQQNTVFTYVGARYNELPVAISQYLQGLREVTIPPGQEDGNRRFDSIERQIRTASVAIINYDENDLLSAVLLGLAAGAGTPTVMTYDRESTHRLIMWGDRPFLEWSAGTLESDLKLQEFPTELRRLVSRAEQ